jgi:hypothetical protein
VPEVPPQSDGGAEAAIAWLKSRTATVVAFSIDRFNKINNLQNRPLR